MVSESIHVVVPAYMEEDHVADVVEGLRRLGMGLKIWVVDDGSKDGTAEKAKNAGATVLRHAVNLGQWAALRTGFTVAILEGADVLVSVDADGQHDPSDLPGLVRPVLDREAEVVIGSRFLDGEKPDMAGYRYWGIRLFNRLVKMVSGDGLTDCTSGCKAYSAQAIRELLPHLSENQYGSLEFIIKATKQELRIMEKPIRGRNNTVSNKGKLRYGYNLLRTVVKELIRT